MRPIVLLLLLAGCGISPPLETSPESSVPQSCPESRPIPAAPRPVWPTSCVADWYAKASLPPCVEKYLGDLKTQQKTIARKRRAQ